MPSRLLHSGIATEPAGTTKLIAEITGRIMKRVQNMDFIFYLSDHKDDDE